MTDHATAHTNQLPAASTGDLALCPIRVGDQITATRDPSVHGQVTYVSDYPDALIECLVQLPDGQKFFAPPWLLRPVDGDQDAFTTQIEALVAA
ncbi:hypothetical protein GPX89_07645 [Nocardia sp. ET3-3]|uniref:Uncharacterized protein n=1 Tax=Nocardia terrae TaxID=2675851 RepID=A0A7K1URZ2_9NOCA|nr:hypothetical protein [Nocardia terrae]MVU77120.1 hypothetical protein [Nocardia terrae]